MRCRFIATSIFLISVKVASAVVVRYPVAAGVGYIELAARYHHLFGLVTHRAFGHHFQRSSVYLGYVSETGMRIYCYGAGVRADVCIGTVESYVTAVGYRHHTYVYGIRGVHHLHEIGTVDHGIETTAVYLEVVAYVAQLLDDTRITLGEYVAGVEKSLVVEHIQRRFVATHVTLVEKIESAYRLEVHSTAIYRYVGGVGSSLRHPASEASIRVAMASNLTFISSHSVLS